MFSIHTSLVYNVGMNLEARITELNYQEVLYYLGYRSQEIDESLHTQIKRCMEQIKQCAKPKFVYRVLDVNNGVCDFFPLVGQDAHHLLKDASKIIVIGATIGNDVEKLLMRYEVMNVADALIMDACASVAIENLCNNLEEDIRNYYQKEHLFLSNRFSPGYGDLPLSSQKQFCELLSMEKRIGVHVSDSYIMTPRKSVTAFMAVSNKPFPLRKSGCEVCPVFMGCEYRKVGKVCGK